jgi:hypothetical protein
MNEKKCIMSGTLCIILSLVDVECQRICKNLCRTFISGHHCTLLSTPRVFLPRHLILSVSYTWVAGRSILRLRRVACTGSPFSFYVHFLCHQRQQLESGNNWSLYVRSHVYTLYVWTLATKDYVAYVLEKSPKALPNRP